MTVRVVIADANILFSRTLRDYFLYVADEGAIEIRWSQQILDEMSRNLRRVIGLSQADTDRLEELMNEYLDDALIEVASEALAAVAAVEMVPDDRHVVAAAISAEADIVLTNNTRHFPRAWMNEHGIELLAAGELLARLVDSAPNQVRAAHDKTLRFSPKTETEVLATLESIVGDAVAEAMRVLVGVPRSSSAT